MRSLLMIVPGLALVLVSSPAGAQSRLGELLDAGARRLSVEQFKREVVQHTIVGPSTTGAPFELMYVANGSIAGSGGNPLDSAGSYRQNVPVSGEWTIDEAERICTAMQITPTTGGVTTLPRRCQYWFKLGDAYYISDSDSDRYAKVLRRSIKPALARVATPNDLGQLIDAGARKLSAAEFRRDVAQRTIVGPSPTGVGAVEVIYAANGSIQGLAQPYDGYPWNSTVSGDWTTVDEVRVCTTMQINQPTSKVLVFPQRCQFWFRLGDVYFLSDSDSDRYAKVLRRSIKQASAPVAAPGNLGELLDAGARRLSVAEFRRDIVQHALSGPTSSGAEIEIMYLADGALQATGSGSAYAAPLSMTIVTWGGEWKPNESERICVAMRSAPYGTGKVLSAQCEAWFKLGDDYFVSDSDSDRRAKVLRRTMKR